jgi:hypothetical protein
MIIITSGVFKYFSHPVEKVNSFSIVKDRAVVEVFLVIVVSCIWLSLEGRCAGCQIIEDHLSDEIVLAKSIACSLCNLKWSHAIEHRNYDHIRRECF